MSAVAEPRRVVQAVMRGISDGRWTELDAWYADGAVVDYPFALPEPTGRLSALVAALSARASR
jgi:hypothetical protein